MLIPYGFTNRKAAEQILAEFFAFDAFRLHKDSIEFELVPERLRGEIARFDFTTKSGKTIVALQAMLVAIENLYFLCYPFRTAGVNSMDIQAIGRQMVGPELRAPGVFGDEQAIPDGASVEDQLLAFAGRKI